MVKLKRAAMPRGIVLCARLDFNMWISKSIHAGAADHRHSISIMRVESIHVSPFVQPRRCQEIAILLLNVHSLAFDHPLFR